MVSMGIPWSETQMSGLMFWFGPSVSLMAGGQGGQAAEAGRQKKSRTTQERTETYRIISHLRMDGVRYSL
jgi:hypothetical protein